jgi:hypothetical protein
MKLHIMCWKPHMIWLSRYWDIHVLVFVYTDFIVMTRSWFMWLVYVMVRALVGRSIGAAQEWWGMKWLFVLFGTNFSCFEKATGNGYQSCLSNNSANIYSIHIIFGMDVDILCWISCTNFCVKWFSFVMYRTRTSSNTLMTS